MEKHGRVEPADEEASERDWRKDAKISGEYKQYQQSLI